VTYWRRCRATPAPTAKAQAAPVQDPQPAVRDILRQYVTYKRNDGVTLSGTL